MSPAAALHAQLASIMEVLANSAVAEICELVDSGYSVLQLEISRSRKENEALRRKLRLMELRTARATALRAAAAASGTARAQLPAHHPGNGTRRSGTPAGEARRSRVPDQEARKCGEADPSSDSGQDATRTVSRAARSPTGSQTTGVSTKRTATVIKIEDEEESWSRCEQEKEFCHIVNGQTAETESPPPPPTKQEVADEGGGSSLLWMSEEVSSTSIQKPLSCSQRSETGSYDCLMFEPPPQHGTLSTQSALSEDPGCSFALNAGAAIDSGGEGFTFSISEQPAGLHDIQQRALPPVDESQLPARKEINERLATFARRGRLRPQGGVGREDGGSRAFVCNCCGKTLACLKNLKTHMRVHTGEKPFVCTLCGKRFSDSSNLKRHQSVHTGEKRYSCVHCGKRFAQSGSLKVHMTVHTDCKQFRCSYCGKTFISASHLRHHVAMHVGE